MKTDGVAKHHHPMIVVFLFLLFSSFIAPFPAHISRADEFSYGSPEKDILAAINKFRLGNGIPTLAEDDRLAEAARAYGLSPVEPRSLPDGSFAVDSVGQDFLPGFGITETHQESITGGGVSVDGLTESLLTDSSTKKILAAEDMTHAGVAITEDEKGKIRLTIIMVERRIQITGLRIQGRTGEGSDRNTLLVEGKTGAEKVRARLRGDDAHKEFEASPDADGNFSFSIPLGQDSAQKAIEFLVLRKGGYHVTNRLHIGR